MRRAGALLLAVLVLLGSALPASAADDPLQLSRDGHTWYDALPGELFDSDLRWVPGDERVATFHVRNAGDTPADLSIAGLGDDADRLVARGQLTVRARVGAGEWTTLSGLDEDHRLTDAALPPSADTRVDVAVAFAGAADNASMDRSLPLDLRLTLADARTGSGGATSGNGTGGAGDGPGGTGSEGGTTGGVLPATGAPEIGPPLLLAGTLIGVGLALVAARRRPDEQEEVRHAAA